MKFETIPGVRLKIRAMEDEEGRRWVVANIWDDTNKVAVAEFASLHIDGEEDAEQYNAWVDATSALFMSRLGRAIGVDGIVHKRRKPDYTGE